MSACVGFFRGSAYVRVGPRFFPRLSEFIPVCPRVSVLAQECVRVYPLVSAFNSVWSHVAACGRVCPCVSACIRVSTRLYAGVCVCPCLSVCVREIIFECDRICPLFSRLSYYVRGCPPTSACIRVSPPVDTFVWDCINVWPRVSAISPVGVCPRVSVLARECVRVCPS